MQIASNWRIIRTMTSQPSLLQMMTELVRLPSMSSENAPYDVSNRAVIELLAQWLEPLGFDCELIPNRNNPDKLNLVAVRGNGPGGLVLAGHSDTVPYDEGRWKSDPFKLTERDQRLHGLGICDMKCFLAMAVKLAQELENVPLQQPLIIVATADEESGMDGIRALVEAGQPKARHAVIGEPTGLKPVRLHKGILMDSIIVHGKAGHSSRPDLGANAIEGLHQVTSAVIAFRESLRQRTGAAGFSLNHPTLNLGCVHGGDSANRIPSHCELQVDLRFPPGFDYPALRQELREHARQALRVPGCQIEFRDLFDGVPAFQTAADARIVQVCEKLTEHSAGAVDFATEGQFLNGMGMETVILGPGGIEQAHQPDEYLALDRIEPMMQVLRGLTKSFCI